MSISEYNLLSDIQYWHESSQGNMEMAVLFLHHGMHEECFSFAGMAVEAMLRAFYIKINGQLVHAQPSYEILIKTLRSCGEVDLDTELFLIAVLFLSRNYDSLILNPPIEEHIRKILIKTDRILHHLSTKVVEDAGALYRYVLVRI
ncbi:hypothetical protein [Paenibacillus oleatilyticus]|uniref:hypothetical protein n=1 Tax=Paenibacillus oleatilyticus TaxID=2594886 RepID=UPI001C1F7814|nr:hypothetical protein [Paenibacillus oleatilyticus]MBU7315300.1 hypothetical protein [Paenibacillus oleatilyticus]